MATAKIIHRAGRKATPQVFPLNTVAGRVSLLAGITAGTVTLKEVEHNVLLDTEKRARNKPVVVPTVYGNERRFGSVKEAAAYLLVAQHGNAYSKLDYAKKLNCIQHRIARYCNADNVPHYYWAVQRPVRVA